MNTSILKKLSLITLTALVLLGGFGAGAWWQFQRVVATQGGLILASESLRNQVEAGMMPDALRRDVLAALQAVTAKDAAAGAAAHQDMLHHAAHFREMVAANQQLKLAPKPAAAIQEAAAPMEEYIQSAEIFFAGGFTNPAAARLPEFEKAFSRLEEKMGGVSDAIAAGQTEIIRANTGQVAEFKHMLLTTLAISLLSLVLLTLMVGRNIPGPFRKIARALSASAEVAEATSATIAEASRKLAAGAGESASSLEETSASLEEIASMIQRTAANAGVTKGLANTMRAAADTGAADMQAMSRAMDEIKNSGDNIAKIIRTIDEIAFQTNLLALNAAVEAARAGGAGAGFAVVADEVRALAQRSAQAARETAAKIEDSIRKSERGVQLSAKVGAGLADILEKARQMDELIGEIAGATSEQSLGISQINLAVGQLDQVTQEVAGNSSTIATAAEELRQQASDLKTGIAGLQKLVGQGGGTPPPASAAPEIMAGTKPKSAPPSNGRRPAAPPNGHTNGHAKSKPADALPMPATDTPARFHDF